MIVKPAAAGFTVVDGTDFTRFHVEDGGLGAESFAALLTGPVIPHENAGHVWVSIDFLHQELGTSDNPGALNGLAGMLGYATGKGWVNADGTHVAAHVEHVLPLERQLGRPPRGGRPSCAVAGLLVCQCAAVGHGPALGPVRR